MDVVRGRDVEKRKEIVRENYTEEESDSQTFLDLQSSADRDLSLRPRQVVLSLCLSLRLSHPRMLRHIPVGTRTSCASVLTPSVSSHDLKRKTQPKSTDLKELCVF